MVLRLFGPGFEQGYATLLILTLGLCFCRACGKSFKHDWPSGCDSPSAERERDILCSVRSCIHSDLGERWHCYRVLGSNGAMERLVSDVCRPQARNLSFPFAPIEPYEL